MTHSPQSKLISRIENYLLDYSAFPEPGWSLVLALWAVATWTYQTFDAFPYLVVTAATKRSGKTRLACDLLAPIAHEATNSGAMTPATLFRKLEAKYATGGVTLIMDEAEILSSESQGTFTAILNMGYRRGQVVERTVQDEIKAFPTYCPKVFVLIGDVRDTLRDRSIVIPMQRGNPRQLFVFSEAETIASGIANDVRAELDAAPISGKLAAEWFRKISAFMEGREAEIWTPIFTVCAAWCPERLDELTRTATALAWMKTQDSKRYTELAKAENTQQDEDYSVRLLRDMHKIMTANRARALSSDDALQLLNALPTSAWSRFRGDGLSPHRLSELLRMHGIKPKNLKLRGRVVRGYRADDIAAALKVAE